MKFNNNQLKSYDKFHFWNVAKNISLFIFMSIQQKLNGQYGNFSVKTLVHLNQTVFKINS